MTPEQLDSNREHFRTEGRSARIGLLSVGDCPYGLRPTIDPLLGVQPAVEWLKGWSEQNDLMVKVAER